MGNLRLASFILCIAAVAARAEIAYTITDLNPPGSVETTAQDINNAGQVVGWFIDASGRYHAYRYSAGTLLDPGTLAGPGWNARAIAINNSGQFVGASDALGGIGNRGNWFVSDGTSMTDLGVPGVAVGINDAGVVSGFSYNFHAFVHNAGEVTEITPGASSLASRINNSNHVAGYVNVGSTPHAFMYALGGEWVDLGVDSSSIAVSINDLDQVVGYSYFGNPDNSVGFTWSNGTVSYISLSAALDVNNLGQIVGTDENFITNASYAAIMRGGQAVNLNTLIPPNSGWTLDEARAINDLGQIVGFGHINGEQHAYLLTPIPEPNAAVLLMLSAGPSLRRKRRFPANLFPPGPY